MLWHSSPLAGLLLGWVTFIGRKRTGFDFYRWQVWGVTIGSSVLQTQLKKRLPAAFLSELPGGVSIAFSAIPAIGDLPEPTRSEVRAAFADSIGVIWQVMTGIAGIGLLASLAMKGLSLHAEVDEKWGIEEAESVDRGEKDSDRREDPLVKQV